MRYDATMANAVEVTGLVKRFGKKTALDGVDLVARPGRVLGVLGPNGAGKTTTLRMLLGLVRPTSGVIRVLGRSPGDPAVLRQTGAMGETAFYPSLSGRDNLRAIARRCRVGDSRVDEVLGQAGLAARARDTVGSYSYGMRQRLGVAAAILKDPRLLILDEPSNGLDPAGQADMRRLIRDLGGGRRTIVLSSHDMDEVEELCDRVGIIGRGQLLAEGTPGQLRGRDGAAGAGRAGRTGRRRGVVAGMGGRGRRGGRRAGAGAGRGDPRPGRGGPPGAGRGRAGGQRGPGRAAAAAGGVPGLTGRRTGGADSVRSRPRPRRRNRAGEPDQAPRAHDT
jgi:ABC-type multidrug transport system ATPase subunit